MPGRKGGLKSKTESKVSGDKVEKQAKQDAEVAAEIEENESKAPIEAKAEGLEADGALESTESEEEPPSKKSGRGRPKLKAEGEEPVVKKSKRAKETSKPSRASQRVSNQKKGVTMPDATDEILPKKRSTKKADPVSEPNEEAAANGAAEETVES